MWAYIKQRIKNVMIFKKPSAWVIALSAVVVAAVSIGFALNGAFDPSDPAGYKALFKKRFAEARKVGLHYTADICRERDAVPGFSEGEADYYLCRHYKSPQELREATLAVFTDEAAEGFFTRFEAPSFIERDGSLYISPWYLFDVSPWLSGDTVTFNEQTTEAFIWDSLTVIKSDASAITYTLDWYHTYPSYPVRSVFTLVKGEDGVWRFSECFGDCDNLIVAFVNETLTEAEARALQRRIEEHPNVEYAEFVTREEALRSIKDAFADESLFENMGPGVLRHRYHVYMSDISQAEQTAIDIARIVGIDTVNRVKIGPAELDYAALRERGGR